MNASAATIQNYLLKQQHFVPWELKPQIQVLLLPVKLLEGELCDSCWELWLDLTLTRVEQMTAHPGNSERTVFL